MPTYTLVWTKPFARDAKRFLRMHPDLTPRFRQILDRLAEDPFAPSLRLHALQGNLAGRYAVSLTYAYRITLNLLIAETEIHLLGIGTHDEVYG